MEFIITNGGLIALNHDFLNRIRKKLSTGRDNCVRVILQIE